MAVVNLYNQNARSYLDVYNALINAYPRKPTWIFKEISGMCDHLSELTNAIATDILYPQTRESAYAFAARCDYNPSEAEGATDTITVTLTEAMPKILAIGHQFAGISTASGKQIIFETTEEGNSGGTDTIEVDVEQKRSYTDIEVSTIDSDEDYADYPVEGYINIIKDSVSATIDGQSWTRVNNFDSSISTDRHFMLIYQSSGKARIRFGNGTNGLKPTIGKIIYLDFSVTEGLSGRMDAGEVVINVTADSDISSITNAGSSGGSNAESVSSIIRNSRANVRLKDALWSKEDLESAARSASSSVQKALGIPGIGEASIHVIPSGGGTPSSGLLTTVETYAKALTQFGKMPITGGEPSYVSVAVVSSITVRDGFDEDLVQDLTEFALTLVTCAFDNQIIEYYDDNGADAVRTDVIAVLWPGWDFEGATESIQEGINTAIGFIIEKWKALLGSRSYREWGQDLEVGDLWIMGNGLYDYGVDIFSLTSPVTNQETGGTEMIDTDTVTVNVS